MDRGRVGRLGVRPDVIRSTGAAGAPTVSSIAEGGLGRREASKLLRMIGYNNLIPRKRCGRRTKGLHNGGSRSRPGVLPHTLSPGNHAPYFPHWGMYRSWTNPAATGPSAAGFPVGATSQEHAAGLAVALAVKVRDNRTSGVAEGLVPILPSGGNLPGYADGLPQVTTVAFRAKRWTWKSSPRRPLRQKGLIRASASKTLRQPPLVGFSKLSDRPFRKPRTHWRDRRRLHMG